MNSTCPNIEQISTLLPCIFIPFVLVIVIFSVWLYCRIFKKTGMSWALGLLVLVPFGNLIILLILAFSEWPIQKHLNLLIANRPQPAPVPQSTQSTQPRPPAPPLVPPSVTQPPDQPPTQE